MNPEDYRIVCQAFQQAVAMPAQQQADYLQSQFADRPDLLGHVQCMLEEDQNQSLDQPAIENVDLPQSGELPTMLHSGQSTGGGQHWNQNNPQGCAVEGYEIDYEIARGGMGVVYKAKQINPPRAVALKMILSGQFASAAEIQRFRMEAEAAANLDHPGIVPIFEVGHSAGQHFFSMGFVPGNSLSKELETRSFTPEEAADMICQIAQAIEYAHQHEIIHRDLKPSNILLDQQGRPKITDFGLAKRMDQNSDLTNTGEVMGSPGYMAPEQATGKIDLIDKTTDIYGLGAILYALLTGKPPFEGSNFFEAIDLVCNADVLPPQKLNKQVPSKLETICLKCLHKVPAARYQSAALLVADLQAFLNGEPISAKPLSWYERLVFWARRKPGLASSWAAVFLFYLYHLGSVYLIQDPISQSMNFRIFSTLIVVCASIGAWYFQNMLERPSQKLIAIYSWTSLNVALVTILLFMTKGVASPLSLIYLLLVAASATLYQKGLVGYVTAISFAGYFIHVISGLYYRADVEPDIHVMVCMSLSILILGMIQYFVVRKVRPGA